jgi:regulator of sigma E protease
MLDNILGVPGFLISYILPFVLVLSLIVFVHEMGHYLAGRWSGIRILAFSIGFGPEIAGFTDKHGTRWKLSAIPLGGYVRFFGDEDAASKPDQEGLAAMTDEERARSFSGAKLWKRAVTVAAGPIANFLFAILVFAVMFTLYGKPVADPVVADVQPGSAAQAAGIVPGDRFVSIDGVNISTFDDIRRYVSVRPGITMSVVLERDGREITLPLTPKLQEMTDRFGNKAEVGLIGVITNEQVGKFRTESFGPVAAVGAAVQQCWHIVTGTFDYISNIITGRMKADQLGGPIRVAQASGQMATLGVAALLQLAAVLSVSIGLLNLMPVPVLDGGHLLFYGVEALRGKPIGGRTQEIAFRIGLVMVLMLMLFSTWNDLSSLVG